MDCSLYAPLWRETFLGFISSPDGAEFREQLAQAITNKLHPEIPVSREYLATPEGQQVLERVQKLVAEGKNPPIDAFLK